MFLKIRYNSAEILGGQAERIDLQTGPDIHVAGEYRLDNRAALCRHLDLPLGVREDELIGHAYLAMGAEPHCAALLGDFAYALFDGRHRRLHLVRDPLGVMPLYYHLGEGVCTVSTSLDVMLSQPDIPHDLDEGVVAEWSRYGHVVSQTDTFYTAIKKVPRATLLRIEEGTTQAVNYWSVDDLAPLRYRNEGDYVEHLHDLLRTAVHDRAGEGENLGAHSSGGLDSTPIAILAGRTCHAQGREFHTYNWCKPESDIAAACHEWSDARDVSLSEGFIHHETGITTVQLEHSLLRHNIARDGSTMFEYERLVLAQAQADGVTRTFSGFGGDELLTSRSRDRHTGAIRQGRLLHALRHLMLESDPKQSMRLPRLALDYARLLRRAWWPVPPHRHPALQQAAQRHHAHLSLLRPEFAAFAAVQREPERDYFLAERIVDKQRIMLDMGYHQERMESWAILGRRHGVSYVYPLLDRRVVEFAFALPAEWYYRQGRPRYLYTRALGDALPDLLQAKRKLPESERVRQLIQQRLAALMGPAVAERVEAAQSNYVDLGTLRRRLRGLAQRDPADWKALIPEIQALSDAILLLNVEEWR